MSAGGSDDDGGYNDDDDDMDSVPLSVRLQAMSAQPSMPAEGLTAEDISESPKEARDMALVQPRTEPIPYPQSAVMGGMFTPDEPSFVDLGGDPNTISSESSSSSEESENIIPYSPDKDPSPTHAATSEAREPPTPMDSRESVGQDDIAGEPVTAVAAQHLREGEEDDIEELPHITVGGPTAGQPGPGSTSTPSGSHQQSTSARLLHRKFLGPGCCWLSRHLQCLLSSRPQVDRGEGRSSRCNQSLFLSVLHFSNQLSPLIREAHTHSTCSAFSSCSTCSAFSSC